MSAAAQVTPVPELVLTVTAWAPEVALSITYAFVKVSGTTTLTAPAIVPINFNTWFLPFDTAPFVKAKVAPVVIPTVSKPAMACSKIV